MTRIPTRCSVLLLPPAIRRWPGGSFCAWPSRRAPRACWCARLIVESTLTVQPVSPAASARAYTTDKMPARVPLPALREISRDRLVLGDVLGDYLYRVVVGTQAETISYWPALELLG